VRRVLAFGASAALALVTVVIGVAAAAGPTLTALESQRRAAVLDLYALDSRVAAAQRTLYALQQQETALRAQQQLLVQQVGATRGTLVRSRLQLAGNLLSLYKRGNISALAVVLGSQSLDDAVMQLDTLTSVTDQSERFVAATQHAQTRLASLRRTLRARQSTLAADVAAARQTLSSLAAAQAARVAFIAHLREQEQVKAAQIRALETRVQHAQVKSAQLTQARTASTAPAPLQQAPEAGGGQLTVSSTGYSLPGRTATGLPVGWGVVSVDPSVIPLGTKLTIPGYGEGVAADVGSAVRGNDIDLWFPTLAQARSWGRRTVTITLH
jgi:3D (Asp-Asp-Asp) domain-containing protein